MTVFQPPFAVYGGCISFYRKKCVFYIVYNSQYWRFLQRSKKTLYFLIKAWYNIRG